MEHDIEDTTKVGHRCGEAKRFGRSPDLPVVLGLTAARRYGPLARALRFNGPPTDLHHAPAHGFATGPSDADIRVHDIPRLRSVVHLSWF